MNKYKVTIIVESYVTAESPDDAELDVWDDIESRLLNAEIITECLGEDDENS